MIVLSFFLYSVDVLQDSQVPVDTSLTSVDQLIPDPDVPPTSASSHDDADVVEGWQKSWDEMYVPNLKWLKSDGPYGIFEEPQRYVSTKGHVSTRTILKNKMYFHPPPVPLTLKGSLLPSMHSFFVTPVLFWRPVGVLETKIKCPNPACRAPPSSFLTRAGYAPAARQVCGYSNFYTLLTERLKCHHCTQDKSLQSRWHATSPSILMQLAPGVRNKFPAVLVGKRAIDKQIVGMLSDRINALSMSKVHRMVERQHEQWYAGQRDLYNTLNMEAHTAESTGPAQRGILPFTSHRYTPPMPRSAIPSARTMRRAHLLMEMENMCAYKRLHPKHDRRDPQYWWHTAG